MLFTACKVVSVFSKSSCEILLGRIMTGIPTGITSFKTLPSNYYYYDSNDVCKQTWSTL